MHVRRRPLPGEVIAARDERRRVNAASERIVAPRIAAHLRVAQVVLDALQGEHRSLADQTNLDPLSKTRQAAAWLLAGRCLSMCDAIVAVLRAGLTIEISPLARTLDEACAALFIMLDGSETKLHQQWLRDGYFRPTTLMEAEMRSRTRKAAQMLGEGLSAPDRTDKSDDPIYHEWSRVTHNRRSSILESYRPDLRELVCGSQSDLLSHAVWVGIATHVFFRGTLTVEISLTTMLGHEFRLPSGETIFGSFFDVEKDHPLDSTSLTEELEAYW